jgi:hypothetical protein
MKSIVVRAGAAVIVILATMSCENHSPTQVATLSTDARTTIVDAAHGGHAGFYFLAPISKTATAAGSFDAGVEPVVEICALGTSGACANTVATYSMTSGPGAETVRRDVEEELYIVNWATGGMALDPAKTYRISVRLWALTLGFADVDVVAKASELSRVNPALYVGVLNGSTLPIKFRIEESALWAELPALTLDRTSAPPGALLTLNGYDRGATPMNEFALVIGNRPTILRAGGETGFGGSVPLFLHDGWPLPPAERQDIVLLRNGLPVAGAKSALQVSPLLDAPGAGQQSLIALNSIANSFAQLGSGLAPVVSVEQGYFLATIGGLAQLINGPQSSFASTLSEIAADPKSLRLVDALLNSSGSLTALQQLALWLQQVSLTTSASTLNSVRAQPASGSDAPGIVPSRPSDAKFLGRYLAPNVLAAQSPSIPCPVSPTPTPTASVSDLDLARKMQLYEVIKLFSETVIAGTNSGFSLIIGNTAGLLSMAVQNVPLAAILGAILQVSDFVANKIIVGLMPAQLSTFDVSLASAQIQTGALTNATVRVVAQNDAPSFGILDIIGTVMAPFGAVNSSEAQLMRDGFAQAANWFLGLLQSLLGPYNAANPGLAIDVNITCIPLLTWEATVTDPRLVERKSQTPSIIDGDLVEVNWRASQTNTGVGRIYAQPSLSASAILISPPGGIVYAWGAFGDDIFSSNVVTVQVGGVNVTVTPGTANVLTSGTQQFAALVTGTTNTAVTWSTDDPGGAVTTSGLYTAGNTPGLFAVTATSAADPSKQGSAVVQVNAGTAGTVRLNGVNGSVNAMVSMKTSSTNTVICEDYKLLANGSASASTSCNATGQAGNAMSGSATGSGSVSTSGGTGSNASMTVTFIGSDDMTATSSPAQAPSNYTTAISSQAWGVAFTVTGSAHYTITGHIAETADSASNQEFGYVQVRLAGPNGELQRAETGAQAIGHPTHLPPASINWSGQLTPGLYFLSINTYPSAIGGFGVGAQTTSNAKTSFIVTLTTTP